MKRIKFSNRVVDFHFSAAFQELNKIVDKAGSVLLTDENVYFTHVKRFKGWNVIVIKAGESNKVQATADMVIQQLINMGIDRTYTIVGVGGGVITDLTGYIASTYLRGLNFGFVPTSLLAMVDASIGGKNGIDVGSYKNMVGTIRQPSFIYYDTTFLRTLPDTEWINGYAEIIKHACILDSKMFTELEKRSTEIFMNSKNIDELVQKNAMIKTRIVQKDEFEKNERRLLNFGHTMGHALENQYELSHGQAISIGMAYAAKLSEKLTGFKESNRVIALLEKFGLPSDMEFDHEEVIEVLKSDKKKEKKDINYVLLNRIGKGVIRKLPLAKLDKLIRSVTG